MVLMLFTFFVKRCRKRYRSARAWARCCLGRLGFMSIGFPSSSRNISVPLNFGVFFSWMILFVFSVGFSLHVRRDPSF